MTSGEIRNWLAIAAVIAGGAWSYFQLSSDVGSLTDTVTRLERDLPTTVATAREAAVASINQAETQSLREIETKLESSLSEIADRKATALKDIEAAFSTSGRIEIGGRCFRARSLVRCVGGSDHMTWIENPSECTGAGYRVEGSFRILAEC